MYIHTHSICVFTRGPSSSKFTIDESDNKKSFSLRDDVLFLRRAAAAAALLLFYEFVPVKKLRSVRPRINLHTFGPVLYYVGFIRFKAFAQMVL
jgi:hypothetical protein